MPWRASRPLGREYTIPNLHRGPLAAARALHLAGAGGIHPDQLRAHIACMGASRCNRGLTAGLDHLIRGARSILKFRDDGLLGRVPADHPRGANQKNNPQHVCSPEASRGQWCQAALNAGSEIRTLAAGSSS
jgi:hypothetical protein